MNKQSVATPNWSTASFSDSANTVQTELLPLGQHLDLCKGCRGRLFALQCMAEAVDGFVAARVVTTVTFLALVIGGVWLLL